MKIEELMFAESGGVPNNPRLPVLVYRQAIDVTGDTAARIEERFRANGWRGLWRDGVFAHHHYHCGAHEVLGIAEGRARLLIGGPDGQEIEVAAGDVILLPAGTGHRRKEASGDFLVVGGYPPGQDADIQSSPATADHRKAIDSVPLPRFDPVLGAEGPAVTVWQPASHAKRGPDE
ncbi:cupin domain-containing protein [Mesorhizobium plurifarium]|uniref:cupin domain-containing protein n=1 Tax=Sinorhizobium arboris TaxID=76745 RepID=UPI00040883D5|nr:cupin domain-containing protein [Sinorhizobium arboris]PST24034.1 cupin domain-containing protein [Mesorhizobium plurifarium]